MFKFSLRMLLGLVTCVGLFLATLSFIASKYRLNPQAETITVCDVETSVDWVVDRRFRPDLPSSGVHARLRAIELPWSGSGEFKQDVLTASYEDHWGAESFRWKVAFWGSKDQGSQSVTLLPDLTGGGNTDGMAVVTAVFDNELALLTIMVETKIGSGANLKRSEFHLVWDGCHFQAAGTIPREKTKVEKTKVSGINND